MKKKIFMLHLKKKSISTLTSKKTLFCHNFSYVEWICRAEDLVLAEDRTTEDDRKLIMEARQKAAEKMKKFGNNNKNDSVETNSLDDGDSKHGNNKQFWRSEKRFRFFVRKLCKTAAWFWFVIVLVKTSLLSS